MFSNELRPDETLGGVLDATVTNLIKEHHQQQEKEKQAYDAALTAAKPLFEVLAILGPWLSGNRGDENPVEFHIQTKVDGKSVDLLLEWQPAIEQWFLLFPDIGYISAGILQTYHLRFLASVNWAMLARAIAKIAVEFDIDPPRFTPQDASPQDAPQGE